jgi:putative endonuclease
MTDTDPPADAWWVYVLLCANERLYVGIARDVDQRFAVHCAGKGAIYTRLNAPVRVLGRQRQPSRSAALKVEYALKQLTRPQKLSWVEASEKCGADPVMPCRVRRKCTESEVPKTKERMKSGVRQGARPKP